MDKDFTVLLNQFASLYNTCSGQDPCKRVQYEIDQGAPCVNAARLVTDAKSRGQNAYTIHLLETSITRSGDRFHDSNRRAALLYLSKLSINSSPLTIGDLGSVLQLLKTEDESIVEMYLILQAMADVISRDKTFVDVLNQESIRTDSVGTLVAGGVARQKRTIQSGKISSGATASQYAIGTVNLLVVPVGIVNKCIDICKRTDEVQALRAVSRIASDFKNPMAQRMADVLMANATTEAFSAAAGATISIVGSGVSVGIAPSGFGLVTGGGKIGIPSAPASGLLPQTFAAGTAYSVGNSAAKEIAKKTMKSWALGEALSHCGKGFVGPIFAVRSVTKHGEDLSFLPPKETKCYSLFDRKLVISLLAYLSVPMQYSTDLEDDNTLKARAMLKNMLGSYLTEDAVRPISNGMGPKDYVALMLGEVNVTTLHYINEFGESFERFKKNRPPSFIRLLCVAAGLISDDIPVAAKQGKKWESITSIDMYSRNNGVWRHPDEAFFLAFKPEEVASIEGMAKSYLCQPWITHDALNDKIKDNAKIKGASLTFSCPSYLELEDSVNSKSRWQRDKEKQRCSKEGCETTANKVFTGLSHCRCCGKIFCSGHIKKGGLISDEISIRLAKSGQTLHNIYFSNEKICDKCENLITSKKIRSNGSPYDLLALNEGDAIVRPMFLKGDAALPIIGIE